MKLLFTIDKKNYKEGGTVGRRPSVRGIVLQDGKVAMMHSRQYGYYKLPGGGMEKNETHIDTLIREVAEESGLQVIPSSVRPFGYVRRIEKGAREDIFLQENFYFFCQAESTLLPQKLDDYEAEEGFTLVFVTPLEGIRLNEQALPHLPEDNPRRITMIQRENSVLALIDEHMKENGPA